MSPGGPPAALAARIAIPSG